VTTSAVEAQRGSAAGRQVVAPYITAWSEEEDPPYQLVERRGGGVAYLDETLADRDRNGVLWFRTSFRHGQGHPVFGQVHPMRQRRTMLRLLCQVCAGPADRTDDGVLWLLKDHREDWPSWPEGMGVTEPPICLPCVRTSVRMCPALRRGAAAVRVRSYPVAAVYGVVYTGSPPVAVGAASVRLDNPAVRWVRAFSVIRELSDCTIIPLTELASAWDGISGDSPTR
jgi:hypothetical protein